MASTDWTFIAHSGLSSAITPLTAIQNGSPSGSHGDSYDGYRFVGQTQGNDTPNVQLISTGRTVSVASVVGKVAVTYYQLMAFDTACVTPTKVTWISKHTDYTDAPAFPCGGPYTPASPIILATWQV